MKYVHIYADQSGDSHFEDVEAAMSLTNFAPPAPPVDMSSLMSSTTVGFLAIPTGWYGPPHPVPRRQFLFLLRGSVSLSKGREKRG
jgi:hypothetical protein